MDNLINTWLRAQNIDVDAIEYNDVAWSIDELYDLANRDPHRLLSVVCEILKINSSLKVLGAIGAGSLEDLLVNNGDKCIDEIVALASINLNFRRCLSFTYVDKDDVSEEVYEKIAIIKSESYQ